VKRARASLRPPVGRVGADRSGALGAPGLSRPLSQVAPVAGPGVVCHLPVLSRQRGPHTAGDRQGGWRTAWTGVAGARVLEPLPHPGGDGARSGRAGLGRHAPAPQPRQRRCPRGRGAESTPRRGARHPVVRWGRLSASRAAGADALSPRAGRRYAQVFVNHDPAAGSSLDHPHAQVVAMEVVPIRSACARARQPRPQLRDGRRPASKADVSIGPDGDNAVASRARQPVHCHVGSEPQTLDRVGVAAQQ
jgi:hypothetical protein